MKKKQKANKPLPAKEKPGAYSRQNSQKLWFSSLTAPELIRKLLVILIPLIYVLISVSFYLTTYDSAQVKITLLHMGGVSIITLWAVLLVTEGKTAFRKEDLVFLAPFLAYFVYIIFSFINAPYKGPSLDDFIRYLIYMAVSVIIIREFNLKAINFLTKMLLGAVSVVLFYGLVQYASTHFLPGADPFKWAGAFEKRIFSTYGNPNFFANYILLMLFIIISQYFKTRKVWLLVLAAADLFCLYATETKGSWVGLAITSMFAIPLYGFFFHRNYYNKNKRLVNTVAIGVLAVLMAVVGIFAYKRMQSVSFRVYTWLSTWEMIETKPVLGNGVGSFKVIYPSFRRPQIFHIEGKHNTETDHAENEYLEQWFDNGIIGFGLFLWLVIFTFYVGFRALNQKTKILESDTNAQAPPVAYDLFGYLLAFTAMLSHNFFDVSMRFVSSGIYLGLLPGVIVALSRGVAIYEAHELNADPAALQEKKTNPVTALIALMFKIAVAAGCVYFAYKLMGDFNEFQKITLHDKFGDALLWYIAWIVFALLVFAVMGMFILSSAASKKIIASAIILAVLYPMYLLWGFFRADAYHNFGIMHSKGTNWNTALMYYSLANKHNPFFIMPYYFKGNVFKDRFDLTKRYIPQWGDADNIARDDFERAFAIYEQVRAIAPNYVQMHYIVAEMYIRLATVAQNAGDADKHREYTDKALERFNLYHMLDPVWPHTYNVRSQIYANRGDYAAAVKEYTDYIDAVYCREPGHKHETSEVYFRRGALLVTLAEQNSNKGDFEAAKEYMMAANTDFKNALRFNPNDKYSLDNLAATEKYLQSIYAVLESKKQNQTAAEK